MRLSVRIGIFTAFMLAYLTLTGCATKLVAPYNAELLQKASAMQAEVAAWDLNMRNGVGTISDDPRHPDVSATISKWHGEAEAMLTLAVSNTSGLSNCGEAVKQVSQEIENHLPPEISASFQQATNDRTKSPAVPGCEAALVAELSTGINDIEKVLKYCKVTWIQDAFFANLQQNRGIAADPTAAPDTTTQEKLIKSCGSEFRANPSLPPTSAGAQHGRAVSSLLTTLQSIVYIENRKNAANVTR